MKRTKQIMLLVAMLCVMSFAVCACGSAKDAAKTEDAQGIVDEPISEEEPGSDASAGESEVDGKANDSAAGAAADTDSAGASQNVAEMEGTEAEEAGTEGDKAGTKGIDEDSVPVLEGSINELKDGQLTVVEAITERSEDGSSEIIVSAAPGSDDSDFNKVTVTYDENTLFEIMIIYDGGARYDISEATAADMAADQSIKVWGSYSGSSLAASQICIVKVDGISG